MTLEVGHIKATQRAWRFVRLAVLSIILIIPVAAESAASPMGGSAFCSMSPAEAVLKSVQADSLYPSDRNSPEEIDIGCCHCLACGAIPKNGFSVVNSFERKTNAFVPPDTDQFSRDGPQGPFRPPRI